MVHQELNQALTRTVQDNLWLGRYPKVGGIMVSERIMAKRTREIFDTLEVSGQPQGGHVHPARLPAADGGDRKGRQL